MSDLSSFINIGANTASFVGAVTSNAIVSTTGTITAAAFATDGVGGDITGANVISATTFTATGNVSAANFVTTGPSGNISGANVISANTFGLLHGGKITEVVSPVAGNYAIALSALGTVSNDQQLLVYPTIIEANHLHLTSGNLWNTELFLGNDNLYVKLANTGNVIINSDNNAGNAAQWTFGTDGNLSLPTPTDTVTIGVDRDTSELLLNGPANTIITNTGGSWNFDTAGNLTLPTSGAINAGNAAIRTNDGPITLGIVANTHVNTVGLYLVEGQDANLFGNANVRIETDSSGAGHIWNFDAFGNLNLPQGGYIGAAGVKGDGTMLTGGPGNITSLTSYYSNVDALNYSSCVTVNADGTLNITTYGDGTGQLGQWNFANATLNIPGNGFVTTANAVSGLGGNPITIQAGASDAATWNSNSGGDLNLVGGYGSFGDGSGGPGGNVNIFSGGSSDSHAGNVTINSSFATTWTFNHDGNLTTPGNIAGPAGGYNLPNFIQPNSTDGNWSFGTYNDGGANFWMQTQFWGDNTGAKGVRFLDASSNTVPFSVDGTGNTNVGGNLSATGDITGGYAFFNDVTLNDLSANAILYTDANRTVFNTDFSYDAPNNTMNGGNISVTANVTAQNFNGGTLNGMQLGTHLLTNGYTINGGSYDYSSLQVGFPSGGQGIAINSLGNADVLIQTGNAGVTEKTWTFGVSGNLTAPGNISAVGNITANNISLRNGQIQSGVTTIVNDGINSITTGTTTVIDVFGFPFTTITRGQVTITGITNPSQANGDWYFQSINTTTFALYTDDTYTTPVDSTGWAAYTGSGLVAFVENIPDGNIVLNANGFLSTFTDAGNLNLSGNLNAVGAINGGSMSITGNIIAGNITGSALDYNAPNFIQPNVNDELWAYGLYSDNSTYWWLQAAYDGHNVDVASPTRGFRLWDYGTSSSPFSVDGTGNTAVGGNLSIAGTVTGNTFITGNIIPSTDNTHFLGNSTNRWANLWLGPGTLYITDSNIASNATAELTVLNGVLLINGVNQQQVGQLKFIDNTIESTTGNIPIEIGITSSSANLLLNRNTVLAAGKTLGLVDTGNTAKVALLSVTNGVLNIGGVNQIQAPGIINGTSNIAILANSSIQMGIPSFNANIGAVAIVGSPNGNSLSPQNPGVMLHLTGTTGNVGRIYNDAVGNYAALVGRRYNGTADAPTQVLANSIVSRYAATPYTSTGWPALSTARIDMVTTEDQTSTNGGTEIQFWTTPIGSNIIAQVMSVTNDNIDITGNITVTGNATFSTNPNYVNNITVSGTAYDASMVIDDNDGSHVAQLILNRSSTGVQPIIASALNNSDDPTANVDVTNGQTLFQIAALGFAGVDYKEFASITFYADDNGNISETSSPGKMVFNVTPDGSTNTNQALVITNDSTATFSGNVAVDGNLVLDSGNITAGTVTTLADTVYTVDTGTNTILNINGTPFDSHGPARGQVTIGGVTTTTQANGTWYYQATGISTMRLYTDASFGNPVDSTTWTAYGPPNVGGGVVEFTQILPSANLVLNSNGYTTTFTNDGQLNIPGGLTAYTDIGTDGNIYAVNFNASGNISATGLVVTPPQALADLTVIAGARAFANDANLVASGNFGAQVANGGSNVVPVWSDGANWYIG